MQVLEKNLPGENQRFLKSDGKFFWKLNGAWPLQSGIQTRILGKNLTNKFSNPVQAIFQFFTPYGYWPGIFQAGDISLTNWDLPAFEFSLSNSLDFTIPAQLPINEQGLTTGQGDIGAEGQNGLGGTSSRYEIFYDDEPLSTYLINLDFYGGVFNDQHIPSGNPFTPGFIPIPTYDPPFLGGLPPGSLPMYARWQANTRNWVGGLGPATDVQVVSQYAISTFDFTFLPKPKNYFAATILASKAYDGLPSQNFEVPVDISSNSVILDSRSFLTQSQIVNTIVSPVDYRSEQLNSTMGAITIRLYGRRKIAVP